MVSYRNGTVRYSLVRDVGPYGTVIPYGTVRYGRTIHILITTPFINNICIINQQVFRRISILIRITVGIFCPIIYAFKSDTFYIHKDSSIYAWTVAKELDFLFIFICSKLYSRDTQNICSRPRLKTL